MEKLTRLKCDEFITRLASSEPTPGGGGAAALAGAIGMALGSMVGELTVGKKKYADVEEDIKALMKRADKLTGELISCTDEDAEAFKPLFKAYAMPKDDPDRDKIMEQALKCAADVPLRVMRLSCEAIELMAELGEKGSVLAISDAATGAALCRAALLGGAVNVTANTRLMKDREYADNLERQSKAMRDTYIRLADRVYADVLNRLQK